MPSAPKRNRVAYSSAWTPVARSRIAPASTEHPVQYLHLLPGDPSIGSRKTKSIQSPLAVIAVYEFAGSPKGTSDSIHTRPDVIVSRWRRVMARRCASQGTPVW